MSKIGGTPFADHDTEPIPTLPMLKYLHPRALWLDGVVIGAPVVLGGAAVILEYLQTGWSIPTTIAAVLAAVIVVIVTVGVVFLSR